MALRIDDIPFKLRAGDIVKHVINIDSRFRENPEISSTSKFYFRLLTPIRNVLRIRITSIEFPNSYYIFSQNRRNVTICIMFCTGHLTITIPDGNYSAGDLVNTINGYIQMHLLLAGLVLSFDPLTGKFTFSWSNPFKINTECGEELTYDRSFDYGLGFNMGFTRGVHTAVGDASGNYTVVSDQLSFFAGDSYVFLKINNFDCVRQTVNITQTVQDELKTVGNDFTALAKIVLRDPKDYMTYDDYSSGQAKEVTFPAPYDLSRFKIQILDPYGVSVDMDSSQFSFSMEVLEVRNLNLYNTLRNAFAAEWRL
jgi:hypothetical protein